jgi:hypothetical protein
MSAETVTLSPTYAPAENSPEVTVFSVPVVAFPKSYNYEQQWSLGLIYAGMFKGAKYYTYARPFVETFMLLKESYRRYKHNMNLRGASAWLAWYNKFMKPALNNLKRKVNQ